MNLRDFEFVEKDTLSNNSITLVARWKKGKKSKLRAQKCGELEITVLDGIEGERYRVDSAFLAYDVRGCGVGTAMYEAAIRKLGCLSTKYRAASPMARRVWLKLIKKYEYTTDFWSGVLTVTSKLKKRGGKRTP